MTLQKRNSDFIEVQRLTSFSKEVNVPASKSYANRMLILAAICKRKVSLHNMPKSSDVTTMLECFKQIGIEYIEEKNTIHLLGSFPECEKLNNKKSICLNTGDGGTTNRFIISLLSLGKKKYILKPSLAMIDRPMDDLFTPLEALNVNIVVKQGVQWEIQGPVKSVSSIEVNCSKSTQFASAIKMILPNTEIQTKNLVASKLYFEMTKYLCDLFSSKQSDFYVPIDFSSLGYPLAMGVTLGKCLVLNFTKIDPYQSDSILLNILEKMGANISYSSNGIFVEKSNLKSIEIDCILCPDLVPTLVYLCSYAKGDSVLKNLAILKHKESDRLSEIFKLLKLFKIDYQFNEQDYSLKISGSKRPKREKFIECFPKPDHRMVMVSFMYLMKNSGGKVFNASHVKKSYLNFFTDFT